jgi:hypothetical protein
MARKFTFAEIVNGVQSRSMSADELRACFVIDAGRTTGLHPRFRINTDRVDIAGLEGTATDAAHALAVEAGFALGSPSGLAPDGTIVAEGDSWFRLPPILFPPTLADVLAESHPIENLAHWGDEIAKMYNDGKGQYVPHLKSKKVKLLLFSGGGNDILGEQFKNCFEQFNVGHPGPGDAAYYLTDFFFEKLEEVTRTYIRILDQISRFSPSTLLIVHGYDYVIPRGGGIFLGVHMEKKGLHPTYRQDLCRAILRLMINMFNSRLEYLASNFSNFRHVDLRGTVGEDEWFDGEIHPNEDAARRLAAKYDAVISRRAIQAPMVASASANAKKKKVSGQKKVAATSGGARSKPVAPERV